MATKASLSRLRFTITSLENGSKSKKNTQQKKGVHSFSAYVTYQLSQLINKDKKVNDKHEVP
jgi:hypothetical protein